MVSKLFLSEHVEAGFSSDRKHEKFVVDAHVLIKTHKYTECSDFTLLFCRGRLRNVPSFIMHVQGHCSAR